jgi:hypothetical protein
LGRFVAVRPFCLTAGTARAGTLLGLWRGGLPLLVVGGLSGRDG